ncbi:MAG: NAD(P)/FAD-dependent oxidoreductase [Methanobrevibacter sp.]|uniref:NAD(P)/FAD-dependent oxidoreductase n=1 Tax=Methanobrevibacter sp. TaxID=66852 RepID=UPI0026E0DDAC|nr:NAD(P)/FAD-dependent oxidoreductase [Methanobrevibacter sp.]MDO5848458.1 NAD(P)/FAD-dependent oxidoreductase [Methanobrevibacter sp.]
MKNIVIGSGPAGRLGSLELGKLGEEVLLIEKNHIAGTCLNEGCMVICALTDITKYIETNNRFNALGFVKSQLDISYEKITEKIIETQKKLRKLNQMENESVGNTIIYGEASVEGENVIVNGESFSYEKLLIATGARPFIPDIPGAEYGLTNKDILKIDSIPKKLVIIGGGIIACEIANIYAKLGSEVTILARSGFLKDINDSAINKYILENLIPEVKVYENVDVCKITKNSVITSTGEKFEGTAFFATGRVANSEIVKDVVELNPNGTIKVNEFMQTSEEHIYAAGDVTGGYQLTPVARKEGICATRNMAGYANKISYDDIPQALTLNLEVSFVEDKNIPENAEIVDIAIPGIAGPGIFWNILTGDTGMAKISFDANENKIKKIATISPSSGDDIAYLSYLMRENYDLDDYADFIEVHPSTDTNYKIIKNMWL